MVLEMLDPTGIDDPVSAAAAARDGVLHGKRLGLLANGKPGGTALLEAVGGLLTRQYGVTVVHLVDKKNATAPARPAVLDKLLPGCDLVLTAIGD